MLDHLLPHFWTVAPRFRHSLRPLALPAAEPWHGVVEDPAIGPVRLSGWLRRPRHDGDELVLMLHGLGGDADSHYMARGALAAERAGLACLRLNLRGADLNGDDFYHAGLTADVHAALASPELRAYRRMYLLGYSLGGHLALRFATEAGDPRVVRVAAVCSPLDLGRGQAAIDSPGAWPYRRYLIARLVRLYAAVAAHRPITLRRVGSPLGETDITLRRVPMPVAEVARLRKIRDFDERVVAPRHGFAGADDYYARASVAPRLAELRLPALLVNAVGDPMVRAQAVRPLLEGGVTGLEVRWMAGAGHVGFPRGLDLGLEHGEPPSGDVRSGAGQGAAPSPRWVDDQVLDWLRRP